MSDCMGKIGEKLHMGGHKKTEPAPDAVQTPVGEQAPAPPAQAPPAQAPVGEHGGVQPVRPEVFKEPVKTEPAHQSPLDKIKNKLHGGKGKAMGQKEEGEAYQVKDV